MRISLIISTYNWPDALRLCLLSVMSQTRLPDEVIVADDGSTNETRELIDKFKTVFPCPLKHAWIPDEGFRLAASRNNAVRTCCTGDYLIFIDHDILLDRNFIHDHERIARPNCYITGGRAKLLKPITLLLLHGGKHKLNLLTRGINRKVNTLHLPFLHPLTRYMYSWKHLYGRGANMAMWKSDFEKVNGFDEDLQGYGTEDVDLFNRLENNGVHKKYAQFCAIEYHLFHPRGKVSKLNHDKAFNEPNRKRCRNGLVRLPDTDPLT